MSQRNHYNLVSLNSKGDAVSRFAAGAKEIPMDMPEFVGGVDPKVLWRHFDIYRSSLAAAGKSQARFVTTLLAFLALLWGWHFMRPSGLTVQILGVALIPAGLWTISPAVLSLLVLSLIGSMNIMGPIWKRLRNCADELGQVFF